MRDAEFDKTGAKLWFDHEEDYRSATFSVEVTDDDELCFNINPIYKGAKPCSVYVSRELFSLLYRRALNEAEQK